MLELVDESLEAFFRASVPLSATDVDVSFEPPDREWSAKLTRPTVNVFLWDIRRSATRSRSGTRTVERPTGVVHQAAPPVLELRYLVTAWATDLGDERTLLGGVIRAILANGALPRAFLPPAYELFETPTLTMSRAGEDHIEVIRLLEGQLKPGLNMMLTTEFEVGGDRPVAPPVREIETAVGRRHGEGTQRRRRVAGEVLDPAGVGALVRSPVDAAYVNPAGQFLLLAAAGDDIVLETDPPRVARVPDVGGVRFEP